MADDKIRPHMFALRPGAMLHEFRIDAVLGHGGFGITYRALDTALRKAVAIKEYLPNELAARDSDSTVRAKSADDQQQFEEGVAAFLDEARLVARLRHRNIMEVLRFFEANGTGYIVLGYEQGRTLKQRLDDGPLAETELRHVLDGLLDGIEVLHNEAILHRDIKPSNIILSDSRVPGERGVPVLIDFGAARDFRSRHSRSVTTIVAPGYAPPEQYGIGGQAGPWSDLYALGATAYRCVTGQAPPEALRRLRKDPYVPAVEAAAERYDEGLLDLIDRLLAVDEEQRPQSAGEVREALRSPAVPPRGTGRVAGATRTTQPDVTTPSRSRRLAGILASVVAAAVIAGGVVLWTDRTIPKFVGALVSKTGTEKVETAVVAAPASDKAAVSPAAVAATPKADVAPISASASPMVKRSLVDALAAGFEPVADWGHVNSIVSVAVSPDGGTLASAAYGNMIKLWDVASGRERRTLTLHGTVAQSVAFSPDGRTLASGMGWGNDHTIKLWDVASGRELRTLTGHGGDVRTVAFSPDGRALASGSDDKTIKLWDVASGRELRTLTGHADHIRSVVFSPNGQSLASGDLGKTIKLWDAASGRELRTLTGHGDTVRSIAYSPDGRTLASGSDDHTIRLWDVASGGELRTLGHGYVASVAFSPEGRTIASSAAGNMTIKLWDVASGQELRTLTGDFVRSVAFSPDGRALTSVDTDDKTIKLWEVASGRELRTFASRGSPVDTVAFSPDGRTVASGSDYPDNTIKLWDVASGRELHTLTGHGISVNSVAFSPDGRTLASGSTDKTIKLWDVANGRELRTLTTQEFVHSIAVSPDGRTLASGGNSVKLWDLASGVELRTLRDGGTVIALAFSPDGRTVVSGSDGTGTIKFRDVASGRELRTVNAHTAGVHSIAFSPDGRTLVSAGRWDHTIKLWDVASGRELRKFEGSGKLALSPDGRTVASASKLWDVASGHELRTFAGPGFSDDSVAFSPDGRTLASGSRDGTIKLFSVADGAIQARYIGMGKVGSITLDGKGLPIAVSGDEDAVYHFVKDGKVTTVSEMRAMGYDLPAPGHN